MDATRVTSGPNRRGRAIAALLLALLVLGALAILLAPRSRSSASISPPNAADVDAPAGAPGLVSRAPRNATSPGAAVSGAAGAPDTNVLRGRVLTSLGAPVVGAKVAISRFDELAADLVTDADGRFESVIEPGPLDVEASADGFVSRSTSFEAPGPDPAGKGLELRLSRAASLIGKVVRDDSGEAVPGCEVHVGVEDEDNPRHPTATTDEAGAFRVGGLSEGPYALTARCDRLHGQGARVVVAPGQTSRSIVIRVRRVAQVKARVELRPSGQPCTDGQVILMAPITGDLEADIDRTGGVLFPAVPPGTYRVDIACKGHVASDRTGKLTVGDADRDEVFAARERATIRGVVVDEQGEPLASIMVFATRETAGEEPDQSKGSGGNDFSSEDGSFAIHDLSPGAHTLEFEAFPSVPAHRVIVPEDGSPEPLRLALPRRQVVGRLVDTQGKGISPAHVQIGRESSQSNRLTEVDADGRFRVAYVGDATTRVNVEIAGRDVPITGDDRVGAPGAGERTYVVDAAAGELRGQVTSALGEPVAEATVIVSCDDGAVVHTSSDEIGQIIARYLTPNGRCGVEVQATDGETGEARGLTVGTRFSLRLRAAVTLRGVLDAGGKPFLVSLIGSSRSRVQRFPAGTRAWEFSGVPAGQVTVQIEAEGLAGGRTVTVAPGETKSVSVELEREED